MLRVTNIGSSIKIRNQIELENIIFELKSKGYTPLIRSMIFSLSNLTNLSINEETITKMIAGEYRTRRYLFREEFVGDIFFTDKMIYILNPVDEQLIISAIGYEKSNDFLQKILTDIENSIKTRLDGRRVRSMKFEFNTISFTKLRVGRSRFYFDENEISLEELESTSRKIKAKSPDYDDQEVEAAFSLVNPMLRQFIIQLAKVSKMTEKDALNFVKNNNEIIEKLIDLDFIKQEYLIMCRKTQQTLAVVPKRELINQEYRCSHCGRPFTEEHIQTIFSLTEKGRNLLKGSKWMSIWVTEILIKSGVRKDNIKWNIESSGDEIDIVVEDFDVRIIFELKDREFGLGDAYPFVYRLTRYNGNLGIIVTMDKVSEDAKKFFQEEMKRREDFINIHYLEGSDGVVNEFPKIIENLVKQQVQRVIRPLSSIIGIDFLPVILNKLEDLKSSVVN